MRKRSSQTAGTSHSAHWSGQELLLLILEHYKTLLPILDTGIRALGTLGWGLGSPTGNAQGTLWFAKDWTQSAVVQSAKALAPSLGHFISKTAWMGVMWRVVNPPPDLQWYAVKANTTQSKSSQIIIKTDLGLVHGAFWFFFFWGRVFRAYPWNACDVCDSHISGWSWPHATVLTCLVQDIWFSNVYQDCILNPTFHRTTIKTISEPQVHDQQHISSECLLYPGILIFLHAV